MSQLLRLEVDDLDFATWCGAWVTPTSDEEDKLPTDRKAILVFSLESGIRYHHQPNNGRYPAVADHNLGLLQPFKNPVGASGVSKRNLGKVALQVAYVYCCVCPRQQHPCLCTHKAPVLAGHPSGRGLIIGMTFRNVQWNRA